MINQTDKNITLTTEQLLQIDTVKKTLDNLQNEIAIATKELNVLNKDVIKATKERIYQEELIENLSKQIPVKEKELENITNSVKQSEEYVKKILGEIKISDEENKKKTEELKDRENQLVIAENLINLEKESNKNDSIENRKDRDNIENAQKMLSETLEKIKTLI